MIVDFSNRVPSKKRPLAQFAFTLPTPSNPAVCSYTRRCTKYASEDCSEQPEVSTKQIFGT